MDKKLRTRNECFYVMKEKQEEQKEVGKRERPKDRKEKELARR